MLGKTLWDKLPSFVRGHQTVRTTLKGSSDDGYDVEPWQERPIDQANMITSRVDGSSYGIRYHRPLLDIDFEAQLLPSSTPGHYHLYLDKQITQSSYFELLRVLARCGIIQQGYADAAIERGATSLRLPWIKKDDWAANQADPDAKKRQLQGEVEILKAKLKAVEEELRRVDNPFW